MIVGRLVGRVDTRLLLAVGLGLTAWSFYDMTGWTPDISQTMIIGNGVVQGAGLGFLFVPLSTVTLGTFPPQYAKARFRLCPRLCACTCRQEMQRDVDRAHRMH